MLKQNELQTLYNIVELEGKYSEDDLVISTKDSIMDSIQPIATSTIGDGIDDIYTWFSTSNCGVIFNLSGCLYIEKSAKKKKLLNNLVDALKEYLVSETNFNADIRVSFDSEEEVRCSTNLFSLGISIKALAEIDL